MPRMEFGKYKGDDITEVPDSYLQWVIRDGEEKLRMAKEELERRAHKIDSSWVKRIVDCGYAQLSVQTMDSEDLKKLNAAKTILLRAITDAGTVHDQQPPF